jgi:transketolase
VPGPSTLARFLWLGERGGFVGMTGFGASGAAAELYQHFGITAEAIAREARRLLE